MVDLIARGPHRFTIITPTIEVDRYGSEVLGYGEGADRRTARGWIQSRNSSDHDTPDRPSGHTSERVLYTHVRLTPYDRIEHHETLYLINGAIDHLATPKGTHHYRAQLRVVTG